MKITVIGRKCTPRDSFKERAEKRLQKVEKFFGDDAEAKITATVEKNEQIVEVTIFHDGIIFRSQERAANMNDALDRCADSIVRQIRKNKTKVEKKLKKEAYDVDCILYAGARHEILNDFTYTEVKRDILDFIAKH